MNASEGRWVLYARGSDGGAVRTQLAELRAFVEGETGGRSHAECFDVGRPGPGLRSLLVLVEAGVVDHVAVQALTVFGRREEEAGDVIVQLGEAGVSLAVLDSIRETAGRPMPGDLQQQVRDVFTSAGVGPDELGERTPSWYHDGVLSLLRAQLRAAYAELDDATADSPPGFGVPPKVMQARIAAARAEQAFAARLMDVQQER